MPISPTLIMIAAAHRYADSLDIRPSSLHRPKVARRGGVSVLPFSTVRKR
jgi:hypothetical protein